MKYWKIASPGHGLPLYTQGETRQDAIKSLDWALGGHNPNRLQIQEIPEAQYPKDEDADEQA
jgi:predicted RNase H-like HicB family nuclease